MRDPFLSGVRLNAHVELGMDICDGCFFPYLAGSVLLRRMQLTPTPARWIFCGHAAPSVNSVTNNNAVTHAANQSYWYSAAQVFPNGYCGAWTKPVRIDIDGSSNRLNPGLPMFPRDVRVTPIAAGKFLVSWTYDDFGQGAAPKDFQVFAGADVNSIDFGTPLVDSVTGVNTVPFDGTTRRYSFTTAAFSHGTAKSFGVRTRNVNNLHDRNAFATKVKAARVTGPSAAAAQRLFSIRDGV